MTYLWEIAGQTIESNEPFGDAFWEAIRIARATGSEVWRANIVNGEPTNWRFLLKNKNVMLGEKCYTFEEAYHGED